MGLIAGQKWCISGNPGNKLSGHHLSVGSPSVCSQSMLCQVLWSGMLGLGRGGQRQLRCSTAVGSNFTACPHQPSMLNCSLLVKLQMFSVSPLELAGVGSQISSINHAPCAPRIESSFSRPKLSDFLDPRPSPPDPLHNPNIMSVHRCE